MAKTKSHQADQELLKKLSARFNPLSVKIKESKSFEKEGVPFMYPLFYVDAQMVINSLNESMGKLGWSDSYHSAGNAVVCKLSLNFGTYDDPRWYSKEDGSSGGGFGSEFDAGKNACTDAFKRAARKWGLGGYLWDFDNKTPLEGFYKGSDAYFTTESREAALEILWDDFYVANEPDPSAAAMLVLVETAGSVEEIKTLLGSNKQVLAHIKKTNKRVYAAFAKRVRECQASFKEEDTGNGTESVQ